jgi:hypothetical protein
MTTLKAGLAYFALVFGAGFVLGALRVTLLVPRLGVRTAELLEMPLMLVVVVLAARFVVRRFRLAPRTRSRLYAGLVALALLVTAELLLAVALQGASLQSYLAGRDPVSGSVFLAMLVVFALMPRLLDRHGTASPPSP